MLINIIYQPLESMAYQVRDVLDVMEKKDSGIVLSLLNLICKYDFLMQTERILYVRVETTALGV